MFFNRTAFNSMTAWIIPNSSPYWCWCCGDDCRFPFQRYPISSSSKDLKELGVHILGVMYDRDAWSNTSTELYFFPSFIWHKSSSFHKIRFLSDVIKHCFDYLLRYIQLFGNLYLQRAEIFINDTLDTRLV